MPSISNESCTEVGPLRWIESAGGPLLLLPSEYFSAWQGVFTDSDRYGYDWPYPDEPSTPQETDYDRACAVADDYLGLVDVGAGQGVVLGAEPMSTAWWPLSATEGILIRWVYGEDAASLLQRLLPIDERAWEPTRVSFHVGQNPLYLFDSAAAGEEETERLTITLTAGQYAIDTAILRPDEHTEMATHRLRRL